MLLVSSLLSGKTWQACAQQTEKNSHTNSAVSRHVYVHALLVQHLRSVFFQYLICSSICRKFSWGVSFSGIQWSFAFGVRSLSRHNLMSYSCFQTKAFTKFVDTICTFFYTHSPFNLCHCTEYKPSALEVMTTEENKLNATKQQFIIAKISGYASHGSKTHSSLCPTNLQLQNQVVLIPRWIRAVEHRKCVAGLSNVQPDFQDWILLNYRRIENAHEVHKKTWYFCYV